MDGEQWFVLKSSLERHIDELNEMDRVIGVATSRDKSRPVAEGKPERNHDDVSRQVEIDDLSSPVVTVQHGHTTANAVSRHDATSRAAPPSNQTVKHENATGVSEQERRLYAERIADLKDQIEDYKQREMDAKGSEKTDLWISSTRKTSSWSQRIASSTR